MKPNKKKSGKINEMNLSSMKNKPYRET